MQSTFLTSKTALAMIQIRRQTKKPSPYLIFTISAWSAPMSCVASIAYGISHNNIHTSNLLYLQSTYTTTNKLHS